MFTYSNTSQDTVRSSSTTRFLKPRHTLSPFLSRSTSNSCYSASSPATNTFPDSVHQPNPAGDSSDQHDYHGLFTGARVLSRALAKLTKRETEEPLGRGIDYFTFHALYRSSTERLDCHVHEEEPASSNASPSARSEDTPSLQLVDKTRSFDTLQSFTLPDESCVSLDMMPEDPSSHAKKRRAKFAKLTRHLGENIPPELVTQTPGTPLPPTTPSPKRAKGRMTIYNLSPFSRPMPFAPPVEYIAPGPGDINKNEHVIEPDLCSSLTGSAALPSPLVTEAIAQTAPSHTAHAFAEHATPSAASYIDAEIACDAEEGSLSKIGNMSKATPLFTISSCDSNSSLEEATATSSPSQSVFSPESTFTDELPPDTLDLEADNASVFEYSINIDINDPFRYDVDNLYEEYGSVLTDDDSFRTRRTRKLSNFFGVDLNLLNSSLQPPTAYSIGTAC